MAIIGQMNVASVLVLHRTCLLT